MTDWACRACMALIPAILCALALGSVAHAQAPTVETVLTMESPPPVAVGETATVAAHLTTASGQPIADAGVEFWVDSVREGRARTDTTGTATLSIRRDLASEYEVTSVFDGVPTGGLQPSRSSTRLEVMPGMLEVETVPPLSGVPFSVVPVTSAASSLEAVSQGQTVLSDRDGVARIRVERADTYQVEILPWDDSESGIRAEFSRWSDEVFVPTREVNIPSSRRLQVGFDVSYLVNVRFVDLARRPVDPERVTSLTLTSTNGGSERLDSEEPRWLQGSRVVRRWDGLEEIEVLHSVESVTVGGSNVVNRGEQRFLLSKDREWQIQLLLYSAQFSVRDALFRFPVGSAIHLEYPDGRSERFPLESGGEVMLESLPRGEYHVSVDGPGISFSRPVALSRDQEVRLELISYLDIAVVFLLVASVALGLLFMGRPRLLFALRTGASRLFLRQRVVRRDDSP